MSDDSPPAVLEQALATVVDPELRRPMLELGMLRDLRIEGSTAFMRVVLTTPACPLKDQIRGSIEAAVIGTVAGIETIEITWDANVTSTRGLPGRQEIPGVRNVLAVSAGKGGVGKTTVSVNTAIALSLSGARVGLLDADVYGPSVPAMMGVHEGVRAENRKLIPNESHGVKLMSLGFMTEGNKPVIWRGPMVGQAVKQMLNDVEWGELDYLLVDLPPGTGDASLTLIQSIPVSGVVVVSTPQDVALGIATKALAMFRNLQVPVLGIVENMSYFECPDCGSRHNIFSHGGGQDASSALGVPFLGEVPLHQRVRESGDEGRPVTVSDPDSQAAKAFVQIARKLASQVSIRNSPAISLAIR